MSTIDDDAREALAAWADSIRSEPPPLRALLARGAPRPPRRPARRRAALALGAVAALVATAVVVAQWPDDDTGRVVTAAPGRLDDDLRRQLDLTAESCGLGADDARFGAGAVEPSGRRLELWDLLGTESVAEAIVVRDVDGSSWVGELHCGAVDGPLPRGELWMGIREGSTDDRGVTTPTAVYGHVPPGYVAGEVLLADGRVVAVEPNTAGYFLRSAPALDPAPDDLEAEIAAIDPAGNRLLSCTGPCGRSEGDRPVAVTGAEVQPNERILRIETAACGAPLTTRYDDAGGAVTVTARGPGAGSCATAIQIGLVDPLGERPVLDGDRGQPVPVRRVEARGPTGRVTATLWHCGVRPIAFDGREWDVVTSIDGTTAPVDFSGTGTARLLSADRATYTDDGSGTVLELRVRPPDPPDPPPCA